MTELLLAAHAFATLLMTGIAWMVQLVHYPLFALADRESFPVFEREHQRRIGPLVAPLMGVEAGTALALVIWRPEAVPLLGGWLGLALVVLLWASTWLLQVPEHARLESGWDALAHARLVRGSWLRTAGWTLRGVLATVWLAA